MKKNIMKYISKYEDLSTPVKASLWFLICGFLQKGIAMISTPIFTRLLSDTEYGQFSIYCSWYGIISIFATLNLTSGVFMRGLVKYEDDKDTFTSSLQGLTTTTILICFIIYILFGSFWNSVFDLSSVIMLVMFIDMIFTNTFQFWSAKQRVDFKYKKVVIVTILVAISIPALGVITVINSNNKVEARILSTVIIDIIAYLYLYIKQFKNGKQFYNKAYWKYALAFNIPLIPHYLSQVVLSQSDRLMINSICGADKAGIYSVAYSVSMIMLIVNNAILGTLHPWIYKKIKKHEYSDIGKKSYPFLIVIAFANFILIALAPEVIAIMAPKSYYEAIWVIPPVAASAYFIFMYSLFADFEFYFEKTKFIMIASILGAILNIILNYFLINIFGFIAAGYTTLVCYILYAVGHYYFMRRINKQYMNNFKVYNCKIILLITFIFIVVSAVLMFLYDYTIVRYGVLIIALAATVIKKNKIIALFRQIKSE